MKAIIYHKYGNPDQLQLKDTDKPVCGDSDVLIQVKAASVNPWDFDLVTGKPHIYRLIFGLFKPRYKIIGSDVAGIVEEVGKNITRFKPGDEVMGDISGQGFGAFAEFACAKEDVITHKAPEMTFEEAAALPQAGILALQGFRYKGEIKPNQKILLIGAGGGGGTIALQIAKHRGAEVTCIDHGSKLERLKSMGADHVIDYTIEDFSRMGKQYDLILDVIAKRRTRDYNRALAPDGTLAVVGGSIKSILRIVIRGGIISKMSKKRLGLVVHKPNPEDLSTLIDLYKLGAMKPVIDSVFPLSKTADAVKKIGESKSFGKIIIKISE